MTDGAPGSGAHGSGAPGSGAHGSGARGYGDVGGARGSGDSGTGGRLRPPAERARAVFEERYGEAPTVVVRAPGRVNLIGEHTDYNDGFVLPLAIDRAVWLAARPRTDRRVVVRSTDFEEDASFALDGLSMAGERKGGSGGGAGGEARGPDDPSWAEYLKGTAWALESAGHRLAGWEGVLGSDVPIGAGLSSSAALELATARAFAAVSGLEWDPAAMAGLAQRAENEWVGMQCGIMDQLISAVGEDGRAVLIDCRSVDTRPVPLPDGHVVVILDTATRRGLVDSEYNERRRQCEAAASYFGVAALRDVTPDRLEAAVGASDPADAPNAADALDPTVARRARHVVTENVRTVEAAEAMARGDAATLGRLMDASHASLRDDFEVSSSELDAMVGAARRANGCRGARMTGAGFGGCAVALVEKARVDGFVGRVAEDYGARTGLEPAVHVTGASAGARVVTGTAGETGPAGA